VLARSGYRLGRYTGPGGSSTGSRPAWIAHASMSAHQHQSRPEMRPPGSGNRSTFFHVRDRCRHVTTVFRVTPTRTALSSTPTGHHGSSGLAESLWTRCVRLQWTSMDVDTGMSSAYSPGK
jgi:hypothetical protein